MRSMGRLQDHRRKATSRVLVAGTDRLSSTTMPNGVAFMTESRVLARTLTIIGRPT